MNIHLAAPATTGVSIAYLVSRYPSVSHTFILREVLGLRRLGMRIDVASVNAPDRPLERMTDDERGEAARTYGIKQHGAAGALAALAWGLALRPLALVKTFAEAWALGHLGGLRGRALALAYAVEAAMVGRWMAQHCHNHLHVHFGTVGSTLGLLVKTLTGCRLTITIHGPDEFDDVPGQHLVRKMQRADGVVCISQFGRSQLMRLAPPDSWHKLQVCRLGVDTAHFAPAPGLARDAGPVRLLCVGRLTPAKGQLLLVEAAARLRAERLDFTLTIVGDGPDRERLANAVAHHTLGDRVRFTGPLNQTEVHAELRRADAFVLPSLAEGIPVVLMEAMASGVPCVTSPVNGIPELVEHGVNGLLALPGDVDALTEQLRRMVTDTALRKHLRAAALQRVQQAYQLERNVAALAGIFCAMQPPPMAVAWQVATP